jgi:hypothetical protein
MNQGTEGYRLTKITVGRKSRDSFPLMLRSHILYSIRTENVKDLFYQRQSSNTSALKQEMGEKNAI